MYLGLGAVPNGRATVTICPPCSYLWDGSCVICDDDDPHPGCEGCMNGRPEPVPWYKSDFFVAVAAATAVSIVSSLVVIKLTGIAPGLRKR